jgi:iron complex outermembrane receptor protein
MTRYGLMSWKRRSWQPPRLAAGLLVVAVTSLHAQEQANPPSGAPVPDATALPPVTIRAERWPGDSLLPRSGSLEPASSTVSLTEIGTKTLRTPGNSTLAAVLTAAPSVGENFAAVGYYENFTIRGFTLDLGSAYRVNGMVVPGEWQFPVEATAALQIAAGVAGSSGGQVGGGGILNQITLRGQQTPLVTVEANGNGGTLFALDAGQSSSGWSWRSTASIARLRPPYVAADGQRSFAGLALDFMPQAGPRLSVDLAVQRRAQPVVPGFQLLGGTTPPDLSVRSANLNAQPWSRPVTNNGTLAMLRMDGEGPGELKWEAAGSFAQVRIDDNLATPFGCNDAPYEFFCRNGDYVLYDYHAAEQRTTTHLRLSAVQPLIMLGLRHEIYAGVERIHREVIQRDVFNATTYDDAGLALSGNIYLPERALPRPVGVGADRAPWSTGQKALFFGHSVRGNTWRSVLGVRWTKIDAPVEGQGTQRLLPRWTFSWAPTPAYETFLSVARGLEFGTEAPATAANAGETLPPRVTRQLEAGLKGRHSDWLRYGLTAFHAERPWEFVEPVGNSWAGRGAWVQRGQQRHIGLEATIEWAFAEGTRLEGRFSRLNATASGVDLPGRTGRQLQNIPRSALYLQLDQRLDRVPGLWYSAAVTARSSKSATADGSVEVGGYALLDLGISWRTMTRGSRLRLDVGLRNTADRRYWRDAGQAYSADLLFPGAPRGIYVGLKAGGP